MRRGFLPKALSAGEHCCSECSDLPPATPPPLTVGHGSRRPPFQLSLQTPSHHDHFLNALHQRGGCRHESAGSAPEGLGFTVILATSPSYFSFASMPVRGQGGEKWVQKGLGDYWGSRASQGLGPPPKTRLGPSLAQKPAMVPTCISLKVQLLELALRHVGS